MPENNLLLNTVKVLAMNFSLVIAVAFLYMLVVESRVQNRGWVRGLFLGGGFGVLSVISMLEPVILRPGIQIDAKYPLIFMASFYGGFRVGALAMSIAVAFRLFLGGMGLYIAIPTIILSWLIGTTIRRYRFRIPLQGGWLHVCTGLLLVLLHAFTGLFYHLFSSPFLDAEFFFQRSFPPLILYPLLTLFLGLNLDFMQSRRELSGQRQQLLLDLAQTNSDLRSIHYSLLHDLRGPLVNIRGFLQEGLLQLRDNNTAQALSEFAEVQKSAEKLFRMIQGLSELDRITRSAETLSLHSFPDLVIRELLEERSDLKTGPDLSIVVAPGPWPQLQISSDRLKQVIQFLLDNALRFRRTDQPLQITLDYTLHSTHCILKIHDNGQGLSPELQSRVFGLFEQGRSGLQGMGLGLALAKRIVEHHHGKIWLESPGLGQGAAVYLELPYGHVAHH